MKECKDVERLITAISAGDESRAEELLSKAVKKKCAQKIASDLGIDK